GHAIDRMDPNGTTPVHVDQCVISQNVSSTRIGDLVATATVNNAFDIYFTNPGSSKIGRLHVGSGDSWTTICASQHQWSVSTGATPKGIAMSTDGSPSTGVVWLTEAKLSNIGGVVWFDLSTGSLEE